MKYIIKRTVLLAVLLSICSFIFIAECKAETKIGYGWSVNPDEAKATEEAISMLRKTVANPNFIFLMAEVAYDDAVIAEKMGQLLKGAKIFGYEVSFAVFTQDGIHKGEKGSLALLGIEAPSWDIGVGGVDMSSAIEISEIEETAMRAIEQAIKDANRTKDDKPSVVLVAPTKLKEEVILRTIENTFGKDVKVMGGTPGAPMVFTSQGVLDNGFSLAVIYADSSFGVGFHSGVQIDREHSGVVTAMGDNNRMLKEIDGRPAFDVYNEWTGGVFEHVDVDNLKEPLSVWIDAGRTPIVTVYPIGDGKYETNVVVPIKIFSDRSLMLGADLKLNDKVYNSLASRKAYSKRASTIVRQALVDGKIKKKDIAGGIHAYCRGAALGQLGQDVESLQVVADETKKEMEGKPFIGGFTAGEQGNIRGHGCFHGNMSSSMVVFSNK